MSACSAPSIAYNVNFDLMYALPRQTVAEAEADLAAALTFSPPHLSFYHLTIESNTLFHRYPPPLPDDETAADVDNLGVRCCELFHIVVGSERHDARTLQRAWPQPRPRD